MKASDDGAVELTAAADHKKMVKEVHAKAASGFRGGIQLGLSTRPINVGAGLDPTQGARIVLSREPIHI